MFTNRPTKTERVYTDRGCLISFLIGNLCFVSLLIYAIANGDPSRAQSVQDSTGQECGVSPGVENNPYLYFCLDNLGEFSSQHSLCVNVCPGTTVPPAACNTQDLSDRKGYQALTVGSVCMPTGQSMNLSLTMSMSTESVRDATMIASHIQDSQRAWLPLLILTPVFAVILSVLYLRLLDCEAHIVFWLTLAVLVLLLAISGGYYSYRHLTDPKPYDEHLVYGLTGTISAAMIVLFTACNYKFFVRSFMCMEAAGECMMDLSSMLWLPVMESGFKAFLIAIFVFGLACLLSLHGSMDKAVFLGLVILFCVIFCWIMETLSAVSYFAVGFMAEEWYFAAYKPVAGTLSGVRSKKDVGGNMMSRAFTESRRHLGSFAYGSIVNVALKPLRTFLRFVTIPTRRQGQCTGLCSCFVDAYVAVAPFNDHAYLEISLDGQAYYPAAKTAQLILAPKGYEDSTFTFHGSLFEIEFMGASLIGGLTAASTYWILKHFEQYSQTSSPSYVEHAAGVALTSFAIGFICSWPFMSAFGHVADALLFCLKAEDANMPFGLGMVAASSRERASLCEVPECFGGRDRNSTFNKLKNTLYDNQPPKTARLFDSLGMDMSTQNTPRRY